MKGEPDHAASPKLQERDKGKRARCSWAVWSEATTPKDWPRSLEELEERLSRW